MQLKAQVILELSVDDELHLCPVPWQNMIETLKKTRKKPTKGVPISSIRQELKKFDADYDGSPYVFFNDKRKYELWQLKYSSVCNVLDAAN